jgi:DNA repair protein RadC
MSKTSTTTHLFELRKVQTEFPKVKIANSKGAEEFIRQFYGDDIAIYESFFLLLLNQANHTIGYAKISQGGVGGTVVDPKIVAKYAVDALASRIILAHNHPSGNLVASDADFKVTKKISSAMELLDIQVMDHLILTEDGCLSLADQGFM